MIGKKIFEIFCSKRIRKSRKFCQKGSKFDNVCGDSRSNYRNNMGHNQPASETAGGQMLARYMYWMLALIFQGIRTSIAKKRYILWFFGEGGGPHTIPPLDPPMKRLLICKYDKTQTWLILGRKHWASTWDFCIYTTLTNFSMTYLVMCKVYTDVRGIK